MRIYRIDTENSKDLHNIIADMLGETILDEDTLDEDYLPVQLIGKSLSLCIRDIIKEKVDPKNVLCIITRTQCCDEKSWDSVIQSYCKTYWRTNPNKARRIFDQFRLFNQIVQPRTFGSTPPSLSNGPWIRL